MIRITMSQTADTRTCDFANVSKETLYASSVQHIGDVRTALDPMPKKRRKPKPSIEGSRWWHNATPSPIKLKRVKPKPRCLGGTCPTWPSVLRSSRGERWCKACRTKAVKPTLADTLLSTIKVKSWPVGPKGVYMISEDIVATIVRKLCGKRR